MVAQLVPSRMPISCWNTCTRSPSIQPKYICVCCHSKSPVFLKWQLQRIFCLNQSVLTSFTKKTRLCELF